MKSDVIAVIEECAKASDEARLTFPEVVARLAAAGVERYHADLQRAEKTYYLPDGASHVASNAPVAAVSAAAFSAAGVDAAVRAVQARAVDYKGFCERIVEAGCVGYLVSIAGRRAVYYGRSGETHVEPFPPAR
jgi:uncharacterized protein YbcV (DUF1398 family)